MNCCEAGSPSKTELDKTFAPASPLSRGPSGDFNLLVASRLVLRILCYAMENQKMEKEMKEKLYRQRKELRRIEEKEKSLQEQTVQINQEAVITSNEILETGRSMSK